MLVLRSVPAALALLVALPSTLQTPIPAVDVKAADFQATREQILARGVTDIPIRTIDAGGHNVGVGLVHRKKGATGGSASHDVVSEVYHVLEGAGVLVTGGAHVNPVKRDSGAENVTQINGPGVSGTSIEGGMSRRIEKGDVVIIPAGTPHWWSSIEEAITYTVVRVDPRQVVTLR